MKEKRFIDMLVKTNYNKIIEISIYILLYPMGDTMKKILHREKLQ